MKTVICILSLIVGFAVAAPAADEPRVFTSSDGTEMVATIQSVIGETVMLQRSDGKVFNIPINRFSALDVEFINRWKVENKGKVPEHLKDKRPRLGLGVSTGETNKKDNQISGYVDEKKQKMNFKIEIENEDPTYPIPEAKVTLIVIGEGETGDSVIVYKKVFEGVELPMNVGKVLNAEPFEMWYDHEGGAMYGYKFKGYCVWVEDPSGKVLGEKTIPMTAARYLDAIGKLSAGDTFDNRYAKKGSESLSQSVKMTGK